MAKQRNDKRQKFVLSDHSATHIPKRLRPHVAQEFLEQRGSNDGLTDEATRFLLPWAKESALGTARSRREMASA